MKRVSDFYPEAVEVVDLDTLLGKDLVIVDIEERSGAFGPYLAVHFCTEDDPTVRIFTTGANVVVRKLKDLKEKGAFPVMATFKKVKRYYDVF